ncbi:MAG: hypothetical protein Q9175_006917 [Cornicularia normoerica]
MDSSLDRATVEYDSRDDDENERIQHTTDVSRQSAPASNGHLSKKDHLKTKAKEMLHINRLRITVTKPADAVTLAPFPNSAGIPTRLLDDSPKQGLGGIKDFAHQPVQTIKAKVERRTNREVAGNLATAEISHAHDVELVRAQDEIALANTEEQRLSAHQDLEGLKKARQDMFVRWTLDRHVLKIRQIERNSIPHKKRKDFIMKDISGHGKMNWTAYGGHLALLYSERYGGQYIGSFAEPPPASQETMSASIERLLVASTPWQEIIMHIRRIYRWEKTNETLAYLAIFLLLWTINCVAAAILLAAVVQVLRRRLNGPTVESLRADMKHTEDSGVTASTISEQIQKRGEHAWIEPMIEDMGPWLLLQLGDMANLLEVILNWLLMKAISLNAGLIFFGLFPIGSRYPDYRLLASPAKWLFWNIPNHAEWAIARLQIEGARQKTSGIDQEKSMDMETKALPGTGNGISTADHQEANKHSAAQDRSPNATNSSKPAVYLTDTNSKVPVHVGICFETAVGSRDQWEMSYDNMKRVEKINRLVKIGSGRDILFINKHDQPFTTANVTSRDEVFTQIIGYSSVSWQVVG